MIERPSVGFVASGELGWATVRRRFARYLRENVSHTDVFPIEDFASWEARTPYLRRQSWLRNALAGRRAAQAAVRAGHRNIVVATLHNAPLLPHAAEVRYLIYGDATIGQLDHLYGGQSAKAWNKRFRQARLRRLAKGGHTFLCMSEWYRTGLEAEYGVDANQCLLVPPTVKLCDWQRRVYPAQAGTLRVLFVGSDFFRKGGDLVLEVARQSSYKDLRFDMVGGPKAGQEGNVVHHGRLEQPALSALFAECDLFVLPTRADCSPNVLVEAGASGLPSISTNVGGVSELIRNDETGTLIAVPNVELLSSALKRYVDSPDLLTTRGTAAFQRVSTCFQPHEVFGPVLKLISRSHG